MKRKVRRRDGIASLPRCPEVSGIQWADHGVSQASTKRHSGHGRGGRMSERLSLGGGIEVVLGGRPEGWDVTPQRADGTASGPGEGASEALVALLLTGRDLPDRWQVLRLA